MLRFCSLYSGSTGNSLFVQTENSKILVDAGVSGKKIVEALDSIDVKIEDIDSILVTHEHTDHTKSLNVLSNKYNIPIYATDKTWQELKKQKIKISEDNCKKFKISNKFQIKDLEIYPFKTPHDAVDSCGFSLKKDNKKVTISTDLGHITKSIYDELKTSDFLMLESNYEPDLLKMSRYPDYLKRRILGQNGHLSNQDASKVLVELMKNGLSSVMLGHISKENNFPELVEQTVCNYIKTQKESLKDINLNIASRVQPSKIIKIA